MVYEVGDIVVVRKRKDVDPTKEHPIPYIYEMEKCSEKCFKVIND